jgi:hypothetical protein
MRRIVVSKDQLPFNALIVVSECKFWLRLGNVYEFSEMQFGLILEGKKTAYLPSRSRALILPIQNGQMRVLDKKEQRRQCPSCSFLK